MSKIVVCAAVLTLMACSSATGVDVKASSELNANQSQWGKDNPHSYSFVYDYQDLGYRATVRITVVNDAVASAIDVSTGEAADPQRAWPTIDGIFAIAQDGLDAHGVHVDIQYDSQYGYPTQLTVASIYNTPGGSYHSTVTDFHATP